MDTMEKAVLDIYSATLDMEEVAMIGSGRPEGSIAAYGVFGGTRKRNGKGRHSSKQKAEKHP